MLLPAHSLKVVFLKKNRQQFEYLKFFWCLKNTILYGCNLYMEKKRAIPNIIFIF